MLESALIYLLAAVISVPLAKRLGMGSVLGYLIAGVLIGPYAIGLVGKQYEVMHFAEFGVVMMLFLIGLELRPAKLWAMRKPILGLGGSQVVLTTILLFAGGLLLGFNWQTSLAVGLSLALSSTAIVLQSLQEKNLLKTQTGQHAFSVLLFQDIAVIPILALMPLLAIHGVAAPHDDGHGGSLISHLATHWQAIIIISSIAAIIFAGHWVANPIFRYVAESGLKEIFTALSLLIVVGITVLMTAIGLSPALGAFLAGVVLAENEYRHEVELDIEPFKGLLLGLFFITVGAGIDLPLIAQEPSTIVLGVVALVAIKAAVLAILAFAFKFTLKQGAIFTVALAQGGEFAFVLLGLASQLGIVETRINSLIIVVVVLSMLISPLLLILLEAIFGRASQDASLEADTIDDKGEVIIAGYGRFGQIVGRLLAAQGYKLTILDHSPGQIDMLRRFGNKVFYGDAARPELLKAAGAEDAKLMVVAVASITKSIEIIENTKKHFPNVQIVARAIDRQHAYQLIKEDIYAHRRETFDSAIHLGEKALEVLGLSHAQAARAGKIFSEYDEESIRLLADVWGDDQRYGMAVKQRLEDLSEVLKADREQICADQEEQENTAPQPSTGS